MAFLILELEFEAESQKWSLRACVVVTSFDESLQSEVPVLMCSKKQRLHRHLHDFPYLPTPNEVIQ